MTPIGRRYTRNGLALSLLVALLAACSTKTGVETGSSIGLIAAPETTVATTTPTTTTTVPVEPTMTTITVPAPPPLPITEGLWPESLEAILIAGNEGVVQVGADGDLELISSIQAEVAIADGSGGYFYTVLSGPELGRYHSELWWAPADGQRRRLSRSIESLVGTGQMPVPLLGPSFVLTVAGARCLYGVPLAGLGTGTHLDSHLVTCGGADEEYGGSVGAAAWSGRIVAMVVSAGSSSWLEFTDHEGDLLELVHNPEPARSTSGSIGNPAMLPGTNTIAYTVTDQPPLDGPTDLVVVDLDDGRELLRITVGNPGEVVTRVELTDGVALVSRDLGSGPDAEHLASLIVDLGSGLIGEAPVAGTASIVSTYDPEPVLFPPRRPQSSPDLVVGYPRYGAVVDEEIVRFEGWTEPGNSLVAAGLYAADVAADGSWSISLTLQPGANMADFTAINADGDGTRHRVPVFRTMPEGPDRWLGLLHTMSYEDGTGWRVWDVWSSPETPLDIWAPTLGWYGEGSRTYEVRYASGRADPYENSGPGDLWLAQLLYSWPREVYSVVDVVPVDESDGMYWRYCQTGTGPEDLAIGVRFDDAYGNPTRAWRVDTVNGRLVEIDPATVECFEDGC